MKAYILCSCVNGVTEQVFEANNFELLTLLYVYVYLEILNRMNVFCSRKLYPMILYPTNLYQTTRNGLK